jgi:hypothetical protein
LCSIMVAPTGIRDAYGLLHAHIMASKESGSLMGAGTLL